MAKNDLKYTISAKDKSKQAFRSVQSGLKATNKAANLLKVAIGGLAVGLAVRRIAQFTNDAIKAGDAIAKTADKVGVGIEALQKLRFAADLAGISQEKLDSSLERFTKRIGEASQGTGEAKKALEILGVSFTDANGKIRPTEAVLSAVADAMASVETPAQRAALAAQLFGREGVGLVNLLKGGSSALRIFGAQAEAAGAILSEDLARSAEVLNDKLTVSNRALDRAKIKIGLAFAQSGVIDVFTRAVQKMAKVMSSQTFARKFKASINTAINVLKVLGKNLQNISLGLAVVFSFSVIRTIGKTATAIFLFGRAVMTVTAITGLFKAFVSKASKSLSVLMVLLGTASTVDLPKLGNAIKEAAEDLKKFINFGDFLKDGLDKLTGSLGLSEDNFDALAASARDAATQFISTEFTIDSAKNKLDDTTKSVDEFSKSSLKAFGQGAIKGAKDYFDGIGDNAANAKQFVTTAFNSLERTLSDFFVTGKIDFSSFTDAIKRGLADLAAKAVITTGVNFLGSVFPGLKFAQGGVVPGVGGPTSDNQLAALSPGEFVMRNSSVKKFGLPFMESINKGQAPSGGGVSGGGAIDLPQFGFGGFFKKVFKKIKKVVKKVVDVITDLVGKVSEGIRNMVQGILDGDIMAIASLASSFILPGLGTGLFAAMGASSGFISGVTAAISKSFAAGILGAGSLTAIAKSVAVELGKGLLVSSLSSTIVESIDKKIGTGITGPKGDFASANAARFALLYNQAAPFLERRARGGPVSSGGAYMVGERGPEVFTPGRAGSVSPSMNASQIVDAVHEVRDEMATLRRQFGRALSGASLAGARA